MYGVSEEAEALAGERSELFFWYSKQRNGDYTMKTSCYGGWLLGKPRSVVRFSVGDKWTQNRVKMASFRVLFVLNIQCGWHPILLEHRHGPCGAELSQVLEQWSCCSRFFHLSYLIFFNFEVGDIESAVALSCRPVERKHRYCCFTGCFAVSFLCSQSLNCFGLTSVLVLHCIWWDDLNLVTFLLEVSP